MLHKSVKGPLVLGFLDIEGDCEGVLTRRWRRPVYRHSPTKAAESMQSATEVLQRPIEERIEWLFGLADSHAREYSSPEAWLARQRYKALHPTCILVRVPCARVRCVTRAARRLGTCARARSHSSAGCLPPPPLSPPSHSPLP